MVDNIDEWNEFDARLTYYFTTLQMTKQCVDSRSENKMRDGRGD